MAAARDWHPADILAALKKRGWSWRRVAEAAGYRNPDSARQVAQQPLPRAQAVIAEVLDLPPQKIWPSRYGADGAPIDGRRQRRTAARRSTRPAAAAHRSEP